ncbi:PD-(D/E)XK nuclease superfamily [uncultured Caudovirales phage]|uniref:PD-(D/E)XK nuclease superfamily n=1 Tax=uncultured Caudovirales phage TaxID=2100421 RepID=A0A6J5LHR9_9CAUD|nr:PD-(D/E)XK nuclease superfamily [uncultured Caudovirales phage]
MIFNYCPPKDLSDLKSETFPDGKRYYTLEDGTRLPSVTTVLGAQKKEAIMAWRKRVGEEEANRVSRKATSRGTNVHTLCERYLNNESLGTIMPDALEMFLSIKPTLNRINNIHYQEQALWSKQLGMAGRVDCIGEFDGKLSVIDFKTSKKIKLIDDIEDYFWQTSAYSLMYEELIGEPINNLVIIMAVENEQPLVFEQQTKDHINGLVKAINFYKGLK